MLDLQLDKIQEKDQCDKTRLEELQIKINDLLKEYEASMDVSLEGDTYGVKVELFLSIGRYGVRMD